MTPPLRDSAGWLALAAPAAAADEPLLPRLSVSAGVVAADEAWRATQPPQAVAYAPQRAWVPHGHWTPLALRAQAAAAGAAPRPRLGVFRWPGFDADAWCRWSLWLRCTPRAGSAVHRALDEASDWIERRFGAVGPVVRHGVNWNAPQQCTVTRDEASGRRPGLHVDTWDAGQPGEALTRVCLNLGPGDRHFLFVPWSLPALAAAVARTGAPALDASPQGLATLFHRHPELPVCRLRLRPGEGYFADTEALIHDGATLGIDQPNAHLTVRARFARLDEPAAWLWRVMAAADGARPTPRAAVALSG